MLEENKIHCGDCMELMQYIPDKMVDMILCDLPYGITACEWDNVLPLDKLWKQYKRILKNNGVVVLTALQPFTTDLINSNRKWFKYELIWDKFIAGNFLTAKIKPMTSHENILIFSNGNCANCSEDNFAYNPQLEKRDKPRKAKIGKQSELYYRKNTNPLTIQVLEYKYPKSILRFSNSDRKSKHHPTEKPIELFRYLIKTYTNEGDLILDNCIGSGTTAVACKQTNRNFIGIEINQEYVDIANRRLKQNTLLDYTLKIQIPL